MQCAIHPIDENRNTPLHDKIKYILWTAEGL